MVLGALRSWFALLPALPAALLPKCDSNAPNPCPLAPACS